VAARRQHHSVCAALVGGLMALDANRQTRSGRRCINRRCATRKGAVTQSPAVKRDARLVSGGDWDRWPAWLCPACARFLRPASARGLSRGKPLDHQPFITGSLVICIDDGACHCARSRSRSSGVVRSVQGKPATAPRHLQRLRVVTNQGRFHVLHPLSIDYRPARRSARSL